jgi:hypothetical protein
LRTEADEVIVLYELRLSWPWPSMTLAMLGDRSK